MSKELEKAIELAKHEYNLLREVANKTGFDNVENSAEALRLVIEAAEELIKLRKDIDNGVLVLEGLEAPKWLPTGIENCPPDTDTKEGRNE